MREEIKIKKRPVFIQLHLMVGLDSLPGSKLSWTSPLGFELTTFREGRKSLTRYLTTQACFHYHAKQRNATTVPLVRIRPSPSETQPGHIQIVMYNPIRSHDDRCALEYHSVSLNSANNLEQCLFLHHSRQSEVSGEERTSSWGHNGRRLWRLRLVTVVKIRWRCWRPRYMYTYWSYSHNLTLLAVEKQP